MTPGPSGLDDSHRRRPGAITVPHSKTGLIDEFILAFAAWNVNALEAEKIKAELLVRHRDEGLTVINQA